MSNNPYAPPRTMDAPAADMAASKRHGGIGRLAYLGITVLLWILQEAVTRLAFLDPVSETELYWGIFIVFACISLVPAFYRMKNAAMNPWTCLLMLVPVLNLVILFRCYAYQEGYGEVKRLDRAGRVVAWLFLALFVGFLALIFFGVFW